VTTVVTVRYFAAARAATGLNEETLGAATVAELRAEMVKRHGAGLERVLSACGFLVDGVACHDDLAALHGGATVDVLPPFAGG
jgi:molybdopterin converting factor small subunit